ncbi:helix-turn-helix transcriptional regulator [Halosimplex sp. J119]
MSPRSFAAVVTVLLVLAGAAPAVALAGVPSSASSGATADASGVQNALPHNDSMALGEIEMRVDVAANGDAKWRVKAVITDDADPDAFADLVDRFNRTESPLDYDSFKTAAANASNATGRPMEVKNLERHHALHNGTGAVWITFTWTNFGATNGDRLAVDDVFNTSTGTWLPSITEDETLVIAPPDGYGVSSAPTGSQSAPSSLSDGVARWEGPQNFGARGPWIVYSGDAATPTLTPTDVQENGTESPSPGTSPGGPGSDGDGLLSGALPLVLLFAVAGASAAVLAVYMRGDDDGLGGLVGSSGSDDGGSSAESASGSASEPAASPEAGATGTSGAASENGSEASGGTAAAAGASATGASAQNGSESADDGADADDDHPIDEDLLSDEERVERLIEQNGGRMKQAAIVQETGWSNAKVSQLLSSMDDDGRIDKLRIGRENLISFPGEDVADLDNE